MSRWSTTSRRSRGCLLGGVRRRGAGLGAAFGGVFLACLVRLDADGLDLAGGDLLEGDRQRLAGDRLDLRGNDRTQAFTELVEVRVDLTAAPCRERHQGEL